MRDSVPSGSYSSVCNVLRQWKSRSSLLIESTDSMIESIDSMICVLITNYVTHDTCMGVFWSGMCACVTKVRFAVLVSAAVQRI